MMRIIFLEWSLLDALENSNQGTLFLMVFLKYANNIMTIDILDFDCLVMVLFTTESTCA